ncbi:MAG: hypothetical protein Q8O67_29055 [Deltaproteobacteria bacterium]|nr:hypothetical protein [Deltaproteobacteria bacterium]
MEPALTDGVGPSMNTSTASATRAPAPYQVEDRELRKIVLAAGRRRQHIFVVWLGSAVSLSLCVEVALGRASGAAAEVAITSLFLVLVGGLFGALRARRAFLNASIDARMPPAELARRVPRVFEGRDDEPIYLQGRSSTTLR